MSVSNQFYSSSLGGANPLKNLLAAEGEKLVSIIYFLKLFLLYSDRKRKTL